MARIDTLGNFLTDVADAIREKGGTSEPIQASDFDTEIANLPSGGGADLSDYFEPTISAGTSSSVTGVMLMLKSIPEDTIVSGDSLYYAFSGFQGTTIPLLDTSNVTIMSNAFEKCVNLESIPSFDTSNVTHIGSCFLSCTNLVTVPILDLSSVTFMRYMFRYCPSLSDTSLDNILQMCIGATSYSSTKTLAFLGLTSTDYPASRIEALPHYSAFTSAGWTIGY